MKTTAEKLKHISLCGIKHSGKSAIGKALAKQLYLPFYDTDEVLRKCYYTAHGQTLSVREIYRTLGEDAFRRLEMTALRSLAETECVAALGGGTLSNPYFTLEDRTALGFLCCIGTDDKTAYDRIAAEGLPPFLSAEADPFSAFCRENEKRRKVFAEYADMTFVPDAALSPEENAALLIRKSGETNHE